MCRAVMAFWSDKSLPKATETTIANSVSPLARSIRSPLQQSLLMTITLSAEMEAFTVAGWQREEREKEVVYHMCGFTGSSFPLSA